MGPKVAFVVLSAFPAGLLPRQGTLEWPSTLFCAILWLPKGPLALFVLPSALTPNTGENKCAFSFIIAQMIFLSKVPSKKLFAYARNVIIR